jgi:hypothetical protein
MTQVPSATHILIVDDYADALDIDRLLSIDANAPQPGPTGVESTHNNW